MITERCCEEMVAKCVSVVVAYHAEGPARSARAAMATDAHQIAREVMGWGLRAEDVRRRILDPLEPELLVRYGHEVAQRLRGAFIDAFEEEAGLFLSGSGHDTRLRRDHARRQPQGSLN